MLNIILLLKGFAVIAQAKEDDMLKRRNLKEVYFEVATCLQNLDENAISILDSYYPGGGVFTSLGQQMNRLGKRDYHLLIAGDIRENSALYRRDKLLAILSKDF